MSVGTDWDRFEHEIAKRDWSKKEKERLAKCKETKSMAESIVTINGQVMTPAQTMAIRVACACFALQVTQPDHLGGDDHGRKIAQSYRDRTEEVLALLF